MENQILDKNRGVVLYRQLADVLRQLFLGSNFQEGSRIPTEFELSRTYGVSRGTVRKALDLLQAEGLINRIPGLGTFLIQKGYSQTQPVNGRSIGLVIPFINDQLSLNILIGVERVAKERGYQLVFNHTNECLAQEKEDILRLRENHVAGIILFPVSNCEYNEIVWQLYHEQFPIVLIDRYFPELDCCYVVSDNTGGAFRATEHLIILGYTHIAFLYNQDADFRTTSVKDRYVGYCKALSEYNLAFDESWIFGLERATPDTDPENLLAPYYRYLERTNRPEAVFAVNDNTALDLMNAASQLGLSIPGELAVVGFDNIKEAGQFQVPLTTINVHRTDLGEKAARLLIDKIEGHIKTPTRIILPTELVIRESCGARQRIRQNRA